MATTSYPVNHPLAVKLWSKSLFREALKETFIRKFMGTTSDSMIQIHEDTKKSSGDRIRVGLRMQLTGTGRQGDDTLEGHEEALVTHYDDVVIDQLRHAVRSEGKMSEQRVHHSVREEARLGLVDWWADRIDTMAFNQLCGNSAETDVRFTGLQAAVEPDASHLLAGGGHGTEASLSATTTHAIGVADIDRCVAIAKTLTPMIRPIRMNGNRYHCMFIHPYQTYRLRQDFGSGGWADIQKSLLMGSQSNNNNALFTGALGMYNNVVLHESTRIPVITGTPNSGTKANFRRAVFCGAQAAHLAFGKNSGPGKMSWVEELFDYQNQLGVSAGCIKGIKKSRFNSADFATIVASGYAPDPRTNP